MSGGEDRGVEIEIGVDLAAVNEAAIADLVAAVTIGGGDTVPSEVEDAGAGAEVERDGAEVERDGVEVERDEVEVGRDGAKAESVALGMAVLRRSVCARPRRVAPMPPSRRSGGWMPNPRLAQEVRTLER